MDPNMDLYVEQPHGFVQQGFTACKLTRPLEGTKQAGNLFMKSNAEHLQSLGFIRCPAEPNIFKRTLDGILIKIGLYVDNLLIGYPRTKSGGTQLDSFIQQYTARFAL